MAGEVRAPARSGMTLNFEYERHHTPPIWPTPRTAKTPPRTPTSRWTTSTGGVRRAVEFGATLAEFQPQDHVRALFDPDGHPFACSWRARQPAGARGSMGREPGRRARVPDPWSAAGPACGAPRAIDAAIFDAGGRTPAGTGRARRWRTAAAVGGAEEPETSADVALAWTPRGSPHYYRRPDPSEPPAPPADVQRTRCGGSSAGTRC